MKYIIFLNILLISSCTKSNTKIKEVEKSKKVRQDSIIKKYVYDCAKKINYRYDMHSYQKCLDEGLKKDSTIAYLWQQKSMPYFKAKKYSIGMPFIDKAVSFDEERWLPYRGFIKCIFSKQYKEAINDFELCINKYYDGYEMDHKYSFYIGLSYLQLNEFKKAEETFKKSILQQVEESKEAHHLDLFYYGMSKYEQQKWEEAIIEFDKSLKLYPGFYDVEYYKAYCLLKLGNKKEAELLFKKAKKDFDKGYSNNEDNSVYETYPYEIKYR